MTVGMPIFLQWLFRGNLTCSDSVVIQYMAVGMLVFFTMAFSLKYHIVHLWFHSGSFHLYWCQHSHSTVFLRSDATAAIFFSLLVFLRLLFGGSVHFFRESADINDGWIKYAQAFIQDGSRMIVVWGLGACSPRKSLISYTFQITSDAIWDKISEHFDDTYLGSVTCK